MGALHEQESNAPLIPMDSFQHRDPPPPHAYTPLLSPVPSSSPSSPIPRKSILSPPPPPPSEGSPFDVSTVGPSASSSLGTALQDPLLLCDAKFARLIVQQVILPRLRVGVLKWKDRETLEFYPQNKDDVPPPPPPCHITPLILMACREKHVSTGLKWTKNSAS